MVSTVVVGESVVDKVRVTGGGVHPIPGGSCANVAVGLAHLGHQVRFVTQLGDDPEGELITRHLAAAGVSVEAQPTPSGRTSTAHATIDLRGAPTYIFDFDFGLSDDVDLTGVTHLHIGSASAIIGPEWTRIYDLAARVSDSALVTYDVNLRTALTGAGDDVRQRVLALAGTAQLVKASDEDLAALWPDLSPAEAANLLLGTGAAAVAVTLGAQGALLHTATGLRLARPAQPALVADTIGAGDSFMAGLIDALTTSLNDPRTEELRRTARDGLGARDAYDWTMILDRAAACAAVTVSHSGAWMPTPEDLGD